MVRVTCDRCGADMDPKYSMLFPFSFGGDAVTSTKKPRLVIGYIGEDETRMINLCDKCQEDTLKFIQEFVHE